jgi:hypothetical protein
MSLLPRCDALNFPPPDALLCSACSGAKKVPSPGAPLCTAQRGANNNHTQLCIKQDQTNFTNSQINVPFIITTQEYNKYIELFRTNTTSLRINIQQYNIVLKQYNIVFKQYNKYATVVVHVNFTILS